MSALSLAGYLPKPDPAGFDGTSNPVGNPPKTPYAPITHVTRPREVRNNPHARSVKVEGTAGNVSVVAKELILPTK